MYVYCCNFFFVKLQIIDIYNRIFSQNDWHLPDPEFPIYLTKEKIFLGDEVLDRNDSAIYENNDLLLLREQKIILKGLAQCVNMNWMSILVSFLKQLISLIKLCFKNYFYFIFFYG